MKAMAFYQCQPITMNPLVLSDFSTPLPSSKEIRLKIATCGVCHTDLHEIEGELPPTSLPRVPGHQIIGYVDQIGDSIRSIKVGERLGISWIYSTCHQCQFCQKQQENLCDHPSFTGLSVHGGFAEYITIPAEFAFHIPDNFSDILAAPLLCAGIIGYRAFKSTQIHKGGRLGLFGFGASAHIVLQIARYWDCEVYVFTRSQHHQDHAKQLGAIWTGTPNDIPPVKLDHAITFAPVGNVVIDALNVINKGGKVVINAVYLSEIPPITWKKLYHERQILSVANMTRQDAMEFLELAGKIPIQTKVHTYSLQDANLALQNLKDSKLNGSAVLKIS